MVVRDILLDTNAYAAFKRGMPDAVEVIAHAPRIGINSIVLGELLSGFAVGTREAENRQELEQFLASERVRQLVVDAETTVCGSVSGTQTPWSSHSDQRHVDRGQRVAARIRPVQ